MRRCECIGTWGVEGVKVDAGDEAVDVRGLVAALGGGWDEWDDGGGCGGFGGGGALRLCDVSVL